MLAHVSSTTPSGAISATISLQPPLPAMSDGNLVMADAGQHNCILVAHAQGIHSAQAAGYEGLRVQKPLLDGLAMQRQEMGMWRLPGELVVIGLPRELADTVPLAWERSRCGRWLSLEGCIHRVEQLLLTAVPMHHRNQDSMDLLPQRALAVPASSCSRAKMKFNCQALHYSEHSKSFQIVSLAGAEFSAPVAEQDGSIHSCDVCVAGCAFSTRSCTRGVTLLGRQICCQFLGCAPPTAIPMSRSACAGSHRLPHPPRCRSVCTSSSWGTGSVVKVAMLRLLPPPPLPHFVPDRDVVAPICLL